MSTMRVWVAGVLAVVVAAGVSVAWAQPAVTNLRVALTEDGNDPAGTDNRFPGDTERIYVLFDYQRAANDELGVSLTSPSGTKLFTLIKRYSGSGTARTPITGADVYRTMTQALGTSLEDAQVNADKVSTQQVGQQEYLYQTKASTVAAQATIELLKQLKLASAAAEELRQVEQAVTSISRRVDEAILAGSVEEKKRAATEVKGLATDALDNAERLQEDAADATRMRFPQSGLNSDSTFTVKVDVGPFPAQSVEFQIGDQSKEGRTPEPTRTVITGLPVPQTPTGQSVDGARRGAAPTAPAAGELAPIASQPPAAAAVGAPPADGTAAPAAATLADPSGADDAAGGAEALATWTVPAGARSDAGVTEGRQSDGPSGGAEPAQDPGGGTGPNLALLVLGIGALVGLALWFRRRML
jgi:hypothetical protein